MKKIVCIQFCLFKSADGFSILDTNQHKKQHCVTKNRFSLFSKDPDPNDDFNSNQSDSMELEPDQTEFIPVKPPPSIFIRRVNDFNSLCTSIKEVTKVENFTC